jgi:sortase A
MGERQRIMKNRRRMRLYALVVAAGLILFGAILLGFNILSTSDEPVGRVSNPSVSDPTDESAAEALQRAAQQEASYVARARQAAAEQAKKKEAAQREEKEEEASPTPAVPSDTTMYLTIPKLGLQDIPVLEGSSEAVLSQGVGHLPGTGFPWIEGSNTYIAGHRLGYPGTVSDHVFWGLPSLAVGDQVILEDSLGQRYTYQVSEILEVPPTDLSVTASTGSDMISLQTCIENYGDYWTPGPNWFVRYIVRATPAG